MFFDHKPKPGSQPDLANLKVTEARAGDVLSVLGAAPDFSDVDFTVDRADQLEAGSKRWLEFSGTWRGHRVYLEVHSDDNGDVYGTFDGRVITLDELGLTEDDLGEIDSRQNPNDFIDWEGKFWLYRFSREIGVFSQGNPTGRGFYAWQFQEQGGKRFLNVRKFPTEPFTASLWSKFEPSDVTVFRST